MKLISWNVNGIRACINKGFLDFFKEADADIFCIQESKVSENQVKLELAVDCFQDTVFTIVGNDGIHDSLFDLVESKIAEIMRFCGSERNG